MAIKIMLRTVTMSQRTATENAGKKIQKKLTISDISRSTE